MIVGVGSRSIAGSFIQVIEDQGLQGLWAGNTINMLCIVPTQAIELGTFECVKRVMTSAQEKWNQSDCPKVQIGRVNLKLSLSWLSPVAVAGAAAGVFSTLVCHPLEVLKDRLTIRPEAYPTISIAISRIYSHGGLGAFYAGIAPTLIGMLPYSTCYYFMYDTIKSSYCLSQNKVFKPCRDAPGWSFIRFSFGGGQETADGGSSERQVSTPHGSSTGRSH